MDMCPKMTPDAVNIMPLEYGMCAGSVMPWHSTKTLHLSISKCDHTHRPNARHIQGWSKKKLYFPSRKFNANKAIDLKFKAI